RDRGRDLRGAGYHARRPIFDDIWKCGYNRTAPWSNTRCRMNSWLRRLRQKPVSHTESVVDVATDDDLYYCFRLFLRREPDQRGWDFWKQQIDRYHITLQALIDNFLNSQEFLERHFNTTYAYVFAAASQIRLVELDGFKLCFRGKYFVIGAAIANS